MDKIQAITEPSLQLWDLPEELIIMILQDFDLLTLNRMYNTCRGFRKIFRMRGVITKINISPKNMWSTVKILHSNVFQDLSNHLRELNMRGVSDLFATELIPVLRTLKSLNTLDVSYTNVDILDLFILPEICPYLRDIAVDFKFGNHSINSHVRLSTDNLLQCQTFFKTFENIHFFGAKLNLLCSPLPFYLLQDAKLNNLTYSIERNMKYAIYHFEDESSYISILPDVTFNSHIVYLSDYYNDFHLTSFNWFVDLEFFVTKRMVNFMKYTMLIINISKMAIANVHAYPLTSSYIDVFEQNFNVTPECLLSCERFSDNSVLIFLNNETQTNVDLLKLLREYLPYDFESPCNRIAPAGFTDFRTTLADIDDDNDFEGREIVLDYDEVFKDAAKINLHIHFRAHYDTFTFTANSDYLRKITFLSLSGNRRVGNEHSAEFFKLLFQCCCNLNTLNVEYYRRRTTCAPSVANFLPLSCSLRNIRLTDFKIDFKALFLAFSRCRTLENIHVLDSYYCRRSDPELVYNDLADPSIILEHCANVYSICISALMSEETRQRSLEMSNEAKAKYGRKTNVVFDVLHSPDKDDFPYYYPYMDVFRPCLIKAKKLFKKLNTDFTTA